MTRGDRRPSGATVAGPYRYRLWRTLAATTSRRVLFVMLNPSTADAETDDPTLRRCLGFASQWGFGRVEVCNLFAYRATRPATLRMVLDPVGPRNQDHLVEAATGCNLVVAAWGNLGHASDQSARVLAMLRGLAQVKCLGITGIGAPKHPLYVPYSAVLRRYP
jgi:hypothetical protein